MGFLSLNSGGLRQDYPQVSKYAGLKLLRFPTTYLCKAGFSGYTATTSKYLYRLHVTRDANSIVNNHSQL